MKRVFLVSVLTLLLVLVVASTAAASPGPPPAFAVQTNAIYANLTYQHANDLFGWSVDIDGDVMAVGSPQDNANAGAVYAYRRVGGVWGDPVRICPTSVLAGDRFGYSVAVDGDRIIVGSPYHDATPANCGAVYIFRWSGTSWYEETTHIHGPAAEDYFGASVAIDNNILAIGAPGDDDRGAESGSIKVLRWTALLGWINDSVALTSPIGSAGDELGYSIDIDATSDPSAPMIVAGAPFADHDAYISCGAVSVFDYSGGWAHHDTFSAPDASLQTDAWFGRDVAISSRRIVVGAPMKDGYGTTDVGEAYTFVMPLDLWTPEQTLTNPFPSIGDSFGWSVAAEPHTLLVGAWYENGYQGAIYPYTAWYGSILAKPALSATGTGVAHFGTSVALSNGTIVGGAQMSSSPDTAQCGAAYVFNSRGTISGVVRDADTGTLLPGMEVSAFPIGSLDPGDAMIADLTFTNGSGAYTLSVDTGAYIIIAMDPGGTYNYSFYNGAASYDKGTYVYVNAGVNTPNINLGMYRIGAVYRFYRPSSGTHFYTPDVAERNNVIATLSGTYVYEGIAYVTDPATDTNPLQRFYNFRNGSHFYTADLAEAANIKANLSNIYSFDGPTYGVSLVGGAGKRPVYRFYNFKNGSHFYTADETERATVQTTLGAVYQFEGPAFYIDN